MGKLITKDQLPSERRREDARILARFAALTPEQQKQQLESHAQRYDSEGNHAMARSTRATIQMMDAKSLGEIERPLF